MDEVIISLSILYLSPTVQLLFEDIIIPTKFHANLCYTMCIGLISNNNKNNVTSIPMVRELSPSKF